jgi:hypothetical protein
MTRVPRSGTTALISTFASVRSAIVRSTLPFSLPRYSAQGFGAKW